MSDTMLISTRKGLFTATRAARPAGRFQTSISLATMSRWRCMTRVPATPMLHSTMAISA